MTAFLYMVLGLAMGIGVTLIYLQERFVRDRRQLLAKGESERVKSEQMQHDSEARLQEEHEQSLQKYKKNLDEQGKQISELQSTIAFLKGENEKLQRKKIEQPESEDSIVISPGGHLLPGSIARAFMKKE